MTSDYENTSLGGVKLYKFTLLVKAALINLLETNVSTLLIKTCHLMIARMVIRYLKLWVAPNCTSC